MTPPTPAETAEPTDTLTVDRVQAYLWRYENDAAHTVAVACMRHWLDTHRSTPSPAGEVKCDDAELAALNAGLQKLQWAWSHRGNSGHDPRFDAGQALLSRLRSSRPEESAHDAVNARREGSNNA